jgi:hypothetical protein
MPHILWCFSIQISLLYASNWNLNGLKAYLKATDPSCPVFTASELLSEIPLIGNRHPVAV